MAPYKVALILIMPLTSITAQTVITSQWVTGRPVGNNLILSHHGKVRAQSKNHGRLTCSRLSFIMDGARKKCSLLNARNATLRKQGKRISALHLRLLPLRNAGAAHGAVSCSLQHANHHSLLTTSNHLYAIY